MRKSSLLLGPSLLAMPFIMNAAYANTLTRLIPDLYAGLNVVSRELVGFIPSVSRAPGVERAAVNQPVVYPISMPQAAFDIAPAMTIPEPPDFVVNNGVIMITKSRAVGFGWTGEEQRGVNHGPGYLTVQGANFAQALRTLVNEIESDLAKEAAANASRAWGTAGTTPFATDLKDSAQIRKILDDNGAPASGRSLILDTSAGANLRNVANLRQVADAGSTMTLRDGELLPLHNLSVKESAQIVNFTKGTGASATTGTAGYAVGATAIALASAGTGTIKAGDVISFAGDTNKYVVVAGDTDVSNGGTITIAAPGLRVAIPAAATAITLSNNYTANIGFSADALHLVARLPALPEEGDAAVDSMILTDPRSGLSFEVRVYVAYRKVRLEVGLAWGVKAVKQAHIAMLLG